MFVAVAAALVGLVAVELQLDRRGRTHAGDVAVELQLDRRDRTHAGDVAVELQLDRRGRTSNSDVVLPSEARQSGPSHRPFEKRKHRTARVKRRATNGRVTRTVLTLVMRHELLHDFLVEARSKRPAFVDARLVDAGSGLRIGPSSVDVDFLGFPIVRARVMNDSGRDIDALVVVNIEDALGHTARASTWIERLAPHGQQVIELYCPSMLDPKYVHWSVTPL